MFPVVSFGSATSGSPVLSLPALMTWVLPLGGLPVHSPFASSWDGLQMKNFTLPVGVPAPVPWMLCLRRWAPRRGKYEPAAAFGF